MTRRYVAPPVPEGDLRFPAKAVALPGGTVLVADAGHGDVVELEGDTVVRRFGDLREPNGLCLLPPELAAVVGYDVVVADTVGHRLQGLTLETGALRVLAGDGSQWMQGDGTDRLSSPWDVVWHDGLVWVAMAGIHQLWTFDPRTGQVRVAAGTTNEGLARRAARGGLVRADRPGSPSSGTGCGSPTQRPPRCATSRAARSARRSAAGSSTSASRDGPAAEALLQHPLGVAVLPDGSVAVADTYNGAVRRYDPVGGDLTTVAAGLAEPSGLHVDGDVLVVVESAAHRLTRVPLGASARGLGLRAQHPAAGDRRGSGAGAGRRFRAAARAEGRRPLRSAVPAGRRGDPAGAAQRTAAAAGTDLTRTLAPRPGRRSTGCCTSPHAPRPATRRAGEGAACHMHQQDWGVPVRVVEGGADRLVLPLSGIS